MKILRPLLLASLMLGGGLLVYQPLLASENNSPPIKTINIIPDRDDSLAGWRLSSNLKDYAYEQDQIHLSINKDYVKQASQNFIDPKLSFEIKRQDPLCFDDMEMGCVRSLKCQVSTHQDEQLIECPLAHTNENNELYRLNYNEHDTFYIQSIIESEKPLTHQKQRVIIDRSPILKVADL